MWRIKMYTVTQLVNPSFDFWFSRFVLSVLTHRRVRKSQVEKVGTKLGNKASRDKALKGDMR